MTIGTISVILLVLALLVAWPTWPHSRKWGYTPISGVGVLLIIVVLLVLTGRL